MYRHCPPPPPDLFPLQSENFTQPPSFNGSSEIAFNSSVHGTTGPITASFPPFLANQFNAFYEALKAIGVPVTEDMSSGTNAGVSLVPSSIDPQSETRMTSVGYREFCVSQRRRRAKLQRLTGFGV